MLGGMGPFPIIAKLGGRDAVFAKLQALGFRGTIHALRMWGVRRSIPGDAMVLLLRIAEDASVETCADDFLAIAEAAE